MVGVENGMNYEVEYRPGGSQTTCAICTDDLIEVSIVFRLPCNHVFHEHCITQWFEMRNMCPLCRMILLGH